MQSEKGGGVYKSRIWGKSTPAPSTKSQRPTRFFRSTKLLNPHKFRRSDPSMSARVYAKKMLGFCRGRRVCPTETIRNHGQNTQSKNNYFETIQTHSSTEMLTKFFLGHVIYTSRCCLFSGLREIAPSLCMTCHQPGFHE